MTDLDAFAAYELGSLPTRSSRERADGVSLASRLGEATRSTLAVVTFLVFALAPMLLSGAIGFFGSRV